MNETKVKRPRPRPKPYLILAPLLLCACGAFQAQPQTAENPTGRPVASLVADEVAKQLAANPATAAFSFIPKSIGDIIALLAGAGVVAESRKRRRKVGEIHARLNARADG